ncbi:MAG: cytochrome b/b6 domain-containing protein [Caulobacterales bacterium]|nr:cytochrome b/b6 domain-containing protein [Caulobacterales bacterium]
MRADQPASGGRLLVYRHPAFVRVAHWINALSVAVLLLSGLQILCAHPAFYWGDVARFAHPAAAISSRQADNGDPLGILTLGRFKFDTTGVLGVSKGPDDQRQVRAFPRWATLPAELDLGAGRRWHFFFAWLLALNGAAYLALGLIGGRLKRELIPTGRQLAGVWATLRDHLRLRFPHGEEARRYNVLQKLAYLSVVLGLLPLMVFTGLCMSPALDARFHVLTMLVGGRQSARTLHFLAAGAIVMFALVHIGMVLAAGPLNQLRSMTTGWFALKPDRTSS